MLDAAGVAAGVRVLDLGLRGRRCSPGRRPTGARWSPGWTRTAAAVAAAAAAVPAGTFLVGDAHDPPAGPFDVVAAVQLLAHVANPVAVLRARGPGRWAGRGDRVGARGTSATCGRSGRRSRRGCRRAGRPAGRRRSPSRRGCSKLVELAGLRVELLDEVICPFDYPDEDALLGPLLASGIGRHAVNRAGPAAVRAAVLDRLAEHRTPDGGYRLHNLFRVLLARPAAG